MQMFCRFCYEAQFWFAVAPPPLCPACLRKTTDLDWLINLPQDRPKGAWELSRNDQRFLRSLRIDADA